MTHPAEAMIYTEPTTGAVARWRWLASTGRPAPRIELYPSPEAMIDEHAPAVADICVHDHATRGPSIPYTIDAFREKVEEWAAEQVEEATR